MRKYALFLAWLIALVGFFISFFIGEIAGYEPCHLCWYQRIALFPLAIILGIATYKDDQHVITYAIPLAFVGLFFAVYQVLSQIFPILYLGGMCGKVNECDAPIFNLLGFITFPVLSLIGFLSILLFLFLASKTAKE